MKRLHLFEFEDQDWFPRVWRDGVTDFLQFAVSRGNIYKQFAPRLILPSLQVNIRGGALPGPEQDGRVYLRTPVVVG